MSDDGVSIKSYVDGNAGNMESIVRARLGPIGQEVAPTKDHKTLPALFMQVNYIGKTALHFDAIVAQESYHYYCKDTGRSCSWGWYLEERTWGAHESCLAAPAAAAAVPGPTPSGS